MAAYYNEIDPFAAAWLRELMKAGVIAPGEVDERDIREVEASDLRAFSQCHFFAGIGVWSYALRLAGWPDDRPVWTGSCPCPPFSVAGKKKKCPKCKSSNLVPCPRRTGYFICCRCSHAWFADARHLWPEMWRLVSRGRPVCVFGEQVAGSDGEVWLAAVRASLEILGYRFWPAGLNAAGFGAPHIRQRLYFVAESSQQQRRLWMPVQDNGMEITIGEATQRGTDRGTAFRNRIDGGLGDAERNGFSPQRESGQSKNQGRLRQLKGPSPTNGFWRDAERDGGWADQSRREAQGREVDGRDCATGRLADAEGTKLSRDNPEAGRTLRHSSTGDLGKSSGDGRREGRAESGGEQRGLDATKSGGDGELGNADREGLQRQPEIIGTSESELPIGQASFTNGFWRDAEWLWCRDGKWRAVEPAPLGLADGLADSLGRMRLASGKEVFFPLITKGKNRVGRLRGYGNALCAPVAEGFIRAYMEVRG